MVWWKLDTDMKENEVEILFYVTYQSELRMD
jgi:hypothetical protein